MYLYLQRTTKGYDRGLRSKLSNGFTLSRKGNRKDDSIENHTVCSGTSKHLLVSLVCRQQVNDRWLADGPLFSFRSRLFTHVETSPLPVNSCVI